MTVIEAPELSTKVGILGFGHQRRDRQRGWRNSDADKTHFLVDDHLLDDAARIVGNAAVVTHDDFDFSPRNDVAVLLDIKLDRSCELPTDGIEARPGHRNTDAHLEDFLRAGVTGKHTGGGEAATPLSIVLRNIIVPPSSLSFWIRSQNAYHFDYIEFSSRLSYALSSLPPVVGHSSNYSRGYIAEQT